MTDFVSMNDPILQVGHELQIELSDAEINLYKVKEKFKKWMYNYHDLQENRQIMAWYGAKKKKFTPAYFIDICQSPLGPGKYNIMNKPIIKVYLYTSQNRISKTIFTAEKWRLPTDEEASSYPKWRDG